MSVIAYCIQREHTRDYLRDRTICRWLDAAYAATDIPFEDELLLLGKLATGDMQLWIACLEEGSNVRILAAVLTRLAKMRSGLHAQVVAAGGVEVKRWIGCMSTIEEWAKREGAIKVTVQGRPGWAKLLRNYRRSQVVLELDLVGRRDEQHDRNQDPTICAD